MKFRLLPVVAAMLLPAGCATQQPPVIQPPVIQQPPATEQPPGLSDASKPTITKDRDRDLSDCEREAAFAGAGEKRQVFNKCMKARGY